MLRVMLAAVAAVLVWVSPAGAAGPGEVGRWERLPVDVPLNAVHVVQDPSSSKVLLIAGSGRNEEDFEAGTFRSFIWEPRVGAWRRVSTPADLFCGGHALLPDGRALVVGGTASYGPPFTGLRSVYAFNFQTESYNRLAPMEVARWYPGAIVMPDGRVVIVSGRDAVGRITAVNEVFDWRTNGVARLPGTRLFPLYPFMPVAATGELFYSGAAFSADPDLRPGFWDPYRNTYRPTRPIQAGGNRRFASACWVGDVREQRLLVIGGGGSRFTDLFDLDAPDPGPVPGPLLRDGKSYQNCVNLPDGSILEAGGGRENTIAAASREVGRLAGIPGQWQPQAPLPAGEHRVYHSLLFVCNTGDVVSMTSNPGSDAYGADQSHSLLLFHPAYEFKGPRPVIQAAPRAVGYGARFAVRARGAVRFTLDRPPVVTHSQDPNQRQFELPVVGGQVTLPTDRNVMPPGGYRLWAVSARGAVSEAWPLHVG